MIAVDTSALVAIVTGEDDAERFLDRLRMTDRALVAAPTAFEFMLVALGRKGGVFQPAAEMLLLQKPLEIVPWTPDLVTIAADARRRYGGRPARLNFGDCMAYALARHHDVPLLYKGGDFAATDIRSALDQ